MDEQEKIIIEVEESELTDKEEAKKPTLRVLKFRLGDEDYCIPVARVKEVIRPTEITRVPLTPDFVKGVINLRGEIVALLDIRGFFGLGEPQKTADSRIIITDAAGFSVGIVADALEGTENILEELIQQPLATLRQELRNFTLGQVQWQDKILILLDIEKVLKCDQIELLRKGGKG